MNRETDPYTLIAILIAAHRSGNRKLERSARKLLAEEHGVVIRFPRTTKSPPRNSAGGDQVHHESSSSSESDS